LHTTSIGDNEFKEFDFLKSYQGDLACMLEKIKLETKLLKEHEGEVV
jgi:hypothetical protein